MSETAVFGGDRRWKRGEGKERKEAKKDAVSSSYEVRDM